jgi:hypothetical protein
VALVGDRERERTSALLRRHYLEGRLTVEELADRVELALHARDHRDLRAACRRLPVARSAALVVREALEPAHRAAVLAVKTFVWLLGSFVILVLFAAWLIDHGLQLDGLLGFPLAWLALTWLLFRRGARRARLPRQ